MAILKKYQLSGPEIKHYLLRKAWVIDDEWIQPELMDLLKEEAAKLGIYDMDESPLGGWEYEPHGEKIPAWFVGFHGTDSKIAQQQKEILVKDKNSKLDPDEFGMAFIYFYFNLKNGRLYKVESESVQ
jgi:hypothetical protein